MNDYERVEFIARHARDALSALERKDSWGYHSHLRKVARAAAGYDSSAKGLFRIEMEKSLIIVGFWLVVVTTFICPILAVKVNIILGIVTFLLLLFADVYLCVRAKVDYGIRFFR